MSAERQLSSPLATRIWARRQVPVLVSLALLLSAPVLASAPWQQSGAPVGQEATSPWHPGIAGGRTDVLFFPDDPLMSDPDQRPIKTPDEQEINEIAEAAKRSVSRPPTWRGPEGRYAMNVNTLDEVPDSSWFTNRHGRRRQSLNALERGPDESGPPADGIWRIVGTVGEGKSEKFMMEDASGRRFIVKLENPDFPELMSAAEVISTKFFHSFGYNVPENYIVTFAPEQLEIEEGAYPAHDLAERLEDTPRNLDGRVRAVASLLLEGEPIGPFAYKGTRPDDPNDIFPHEHRRELRGMKVFAAWLNHTDTKSTNSLDTYVGEDGEGWVRHQLLDFGSTLGSGVSDAKDRVIGWEYYLEPDKILKGIYRLGLWERPYVKIDYPDYPALGRIEADHFDPPHWRPLIPNPAFRLMDAADAFWGAKIVASYTDEEVRTLVEEGRITDPEAEDHLVDLLIRRRDKVVAYWLTRTNPLDEFRLDQGEAGPVLRFENLAVARGLASPSLTHRYRWYRLDNHGGVRTPAGSWASAAGSGPAAAVPLPADAWGPPDEFGLRYALVEIHSVHPGHPHWDQPVTVVIRNQGGGGGRAGELAVVGIRRPRGMPEDSHVAGGGR